MQQEKIMRALFRGHEIVVRNVWSANGALVSETTLAFDGAIVARTTEWSTRKAVLCATLRDRGNHYAVEVLFGGVFAVRMKILVDGRKVAGDLR